jgi:hypothetical protein
MAAFTQLDEEMRSDSMRPVATLALEPGDFSERYGLRFSEGPSNLGKSLGALVQTGPGRQFALMQYLDSPTSGLELMAPEQADPAEALYRFLAAFDLDERVVTWSLAAENPARASSS